MVDAVPTADEAGLYIASDNGYFAQQGLTVKIVPINGGELGMPDLQDGKAQIVVGNYVSFILAQISGKFGTQPISMRIIADGSLMQPGNQALYVMPKSRFKTVSDLKKYDARIGLNTKNNIGQVLLGSLFQENGLQLKNIRQVYAPFPLMIQMLIKGQIDVAWLPEPFGTMVEQQFGAVQLADFDQGALENFPIGGYIGTAQWVRSHSEHCGGLPARPEGGPAGRGHRPCRGGSRAREEHQDAAGHRVHDNDQFLPAGHERRHDAARLGRYVRVRSHARLHEAVLDR